jgi:hypothetical protein
MILVMTTGWAGAVIVLACYAGVTSDRIRASGTAYFLLNTLGATLLGVNAAVMQAWPSCIANVLWILVGVRPLIRSLRPSAQGLAGAVPPPSEPHKGTESPRATAPR